VLSRKPQPRLLFIGEANANYRIRLESEDKVGRFSTSKSMETQASYDKDLRAIGQALEIRGITTFELKSQLGHYVVHGAGEKPASVMASVRRWLQGAEKEESTSISYTAQDIERIDQEGKQRRVRAGRLPDFYSLSNTLRTLGGYLNSKNAQLLELHIRPLTVTLLYQNKDGHPQMEDRTIASFFNVFTEMHGKRGRKT
jgi:hypothetical protein